MAEFTKLKITEVGKELLNEEVLSPEAMEFTRIGLSKHVYEEAELGSLEGLEEICQWNSIRKVTVEKDVVVVDFIVNNEGLEKGYFIRTMGLYARMGEGEEILFASAAETSGGCYMPKHSETITSVEIKLRLRLDNVEKVKLVVDTGGLATLGDVLDVQSNLESETNRAQEAENQLQERIEEETSRAELAEDELQARIQEEKVRAELAEGTLQEGIDTESVRAGEEEAKLRQSKLDKDGDASETVVGFAEASELSPLSSGSKLSVLMGMIARGISSLISHIAHRSNPHGVTKSQVGLGNADNTSDTDKPVSTAQRAAIDASYQQATGYTNQKIADLIGGAPTTLDTLGEIADAMAENADVVAALNVAIGKKANEAEFDSHAKNTTAHITASERNYWNGKAEGNHTHNYSAPGHTHDDRYYTESEMNTKLAGKADSGHTHNYAASGHSHDDRYYTESEMNTKLAGKADSGHTHNYAAASHSHDDRYYTESEMNTKLGGKADNGHTHNYLPLGGGKLTGNLNVGDKVWLDANNEGGNVKLAAPDGTKWEIDAYDGNLRVFTHANNVKQGIVIDKAGYTHFPCGIFDSTQVIGGFRFKPINNGGHGWADFFHKTANGENVYNNLSIYVNENDAFIRANRGILFLSSNNSAGVGCLLTGTQTFCPIVASAFNVGSSRRYKKNILPITEKRAKRILEVEVVTYDYLDGIMDSEVQYDRSGVIAEDTADVIPEAVAYKEIDGEVVPDGVDYSRFVPYLIRLAQMQQAEIDKMKTEICELKNKNA